MKFNLIFLFLFLSIAAISWTSCEDTKKTVIVYPYDGSDKDTIDCGDGLKMITIRDGSGASPVSGQYVQIQYSLFNQNSPYSVVESTLYSGDPATFCLHPDSVIQGFYKGILKMKIGQKSKILVPWKLGYGADGGATIAPYSNLIFDVELLAIFDKRPK